MYSYEGFYIYGEKKAKGDDDPTYNVPGIDQFYTSYWLNRLFEVPEFKAAAKARWQQKSAALNNAINVKIQNFADEIAPSIPCNEYILPRLGVYEWNGPNDYDKRTTYKAEVDYLIWWCQNRYNWMNSEIANF